MDKNHKHVPEPEEGAKAVRTHIALTKYRAMVKHLQGPIACSQFKKSNIINDAGYEMEDHIAHAIIGITDEAGELISILKKRFWYGAEYSEEHIKEELGDLFHYMMYLMIEYDWTLEDIMRANTEKLSKRYPEGFNVEDAIKRRDKTQDNDPHAECMCPGCKAARGRKSKQDRQGKSESRVEKRPRIEFEGQR